MKAYILFFVRTITIVYGLKHSLTLVRKINDNAICRDAATDARKFSLDQISWFMPHVISAIAEKVSIYKIIVLKVKLRVAYRTRYCDMPSVPESTSFTWRLSIKTASDKPRFTIVGFQTDNDGDQTKNPSFFDHANLKISYITLNSDRYPRLIIICRSQTRNLLGCMVINPSLKINSLVWMN